MVLSETGESRVNGYLYVLGRSLGAFLPKDVKADALREIESHLRERIAAAAATPDERAALERILSDLGPPMRVAQAYSAERIVDEAIATGRVVPVLRAIWHLAVSTVAGFVLAVVLLIGYVLGAGLVIVAAMKPIFPANVGLWTVNGVPRAFGAMSPAPPGAELVGGYWIVPIALALGLLVLVGTHRAARAMLARWRARRAPAEGGAVFE